MKIQGLGKIRGDLMDDEFVFVLCLSIENGRDRARD